MKPALTLAACILVGAPAAFVIYTVVTTWWYEKVWLPKIAGED
jgi:hypothetical protein